MNIVKIFYKILGVFLILLVTSSCFFDGIKGNGNVIVKKRNISDDFIRIQASENIDVFITEMGETSLVVEADANLHDIIETKVENGTLYIGVKKSIWSAKAKMVYLSFEKLNEIVVTSGAELTSENTVGADNLKITATSGAEINLHLNVNNLDCEGTSGADINLDGKAKFLKINSSSGSDIDAFGLTVQNCIVSATSGSDIKVNVEKLFEGTATSGADIRYKGDPEIVKSNNNSAGKIKKS